MIKIEIDSDKVTTRSGVSSRTGKPYEIREQPAYAYLPGQKYPSPIPVNLDSDQPPYAPGNYTLMPECLFIGKYGLQLGKLKLAPLGQK